MRKLHLGIVDWQGNAGIFDLPKTAFLCSRSVPASAVLRPEKTLQDEAHKDRLCDELLTWQAVEKIEIFHDQMLGAGLEIDRTL
ncbi:MAG: hypothetical protein EPO28_08190, partial [Saprospiraceae bacterium]